MVELLLTPEQHALLLELVEDEISRVRADVVEFDLGDPHWCEMVKRARALRGLMSEIETATI